MDSAQPQARSLREAQSACLRIWIYGSPRNDTELVSFNGASDSHVSLPLREVEAASSHLLPFQTYVSHRNVRAQLVFAVAAIFQGLAEPAAGFAVTVAVDVTDAGAGAHQVIGGALEVDPDVADA